MLMYYVAYGLQIASELVVPELFSTRVKSPDVSIRLGAIPADPSDLLRVNRSSQAQARPFILHVPSVARYLIVDGQTIWIEADTESAEVDVRVFLLGSAFGALLHQRHMLPMHASAIQTARGAVLFTGPQGHGKSTLLAALLQRGYAMLADDVTALDIDAAGRVLAFPSIPCMRLWADSASRLKQSVEGQRRVRASLDKYLLPVSQFCTEPLPVRAIYALDTAPVSTIQIEPVDHHQRFELLANNTYRAEFLGGLGLLQTHFRLVATVGNLVPVYRITRPSHLFLLDDLVDRIEAALAA